MTQPRPVWKSPGVPEAAGPHPVCTSAGCVPAGEEVKEVHVHSRSVWRPGPERPWGPGRRAELWSGGPESPPCPSAWLHVVSAHPRSSGFCRWKSGNVFCSLQVETSWIKSGDAPLGSCPCSPVRVGHREEPQWVAGRDTLPSPRRSTGSTHPR